MIDKAVPNEVWHGVRANQVCLLVVKSFRDSFLSLFGFYITLDENDAFDIHHFKQVDSDDSLSIAL